MGNSNSSTGSTGNTNTNRANNQNSNGNSQHTSLPSSSSQSSSLPSTSPHHHLVHTLSSKFAKSTGTLGLSKAELDKRCKPSGLYDSCSWDEKAIRRLIGDGRIAARLPACENGGKECPICFLEYTQVNITSCCRAYICTECYLQIRPQKDATSICPFCTSNKLTVTVASAENEKEEQHQEQETSQETSPTPSSSTTITEFGKSLERHNSRRVELEKSSSVAEASVMSVDERKLLEEEMKQQHLHPLSQRIEQEAEERRREHDLSYNNNMRRRTNNRLRFGTHHHRSLLGAGGSRSTRSLGRRRDRDWNQIVEAFENHFGTGEVQSLDDLVVIEAAILLSMEEEAAQRRRARQLDSPSELDSTTSTTRSGFPLLHSFMSSRGSSTSALRTSLHNTEEEQDDHDALETSNTLPQLSSIRRSRLGRSASSRRATAIDDTTNLMMRGVSEEEQIAMAIALSLRESEQSENNNSEASTENNTSSRSGGDEAGSANTENQDETHEIS